MCICTIVCVRKVCEYCTTIRIVRELLKFGSSYGTVVKVNTPLSRLDLLKIEEKLLANSFAPG